MLTRESAARKDSTTAASAELQHRHFAFIAATINGIGFSREEKRIIAERFAEACARTNPRFDHARFMAACGV